jgi:hypothetical protein
VSDEPERPARLDPDRAIEAVRADQDARSSADPGVERAPRLPPPVIDTRKYQWMIGGFGVLLLFIFSVYLFAHGGRGTLGIPAGKPLVKFVAPLATSDLNVAANAHPRCNPARPAKRGLNVCGHAPIVLDFFALDGTCEREVDALNAVAPEFPRLQFAAVAVNASRSQTLALVRKRHWTLPVAYDESGVIGQLYGVEVCPIIELARTGGIVSDLLIGEDWERPAQLAARVRTFAAQVGAA